MATVVIVLVFYVYSLMRVFLCVWLTYMDMGHVQKISCAFPDVSSVVVFQRRYPLICVIYNVSKYYIGNTNHFTIENCLRSLWYRVK